MKKDQYGVWEITLPPKSPGVCAIPHDSMLKVRHIHTLAHKAATMSLDLHDYTERIADRTPSCLDQASHSEPRGLAHL
jgi:hypothetical protein